MKRMKTCPFYSNAIQKCKKNIRAKENLGIY